jgi:hypothetical protein
MYQGFKYRHESESRSDSHLAGQDFLLFSEESEFLLQYSQQLVTDPYFIPDEYKRHPHILLL